MVWLWLILPGFLALVALYDVMQRDHAILRNFPVIGHFRYWLEMIGPELRQYIVTSNDEERPFSRDERRWVYASSKRQNNYFGFGTDDELERSSNYVIIKHAAFPIHRKDPDGTYRIPCSKVLGGFRKRAKAFRPPSLVNLSGMSFGSLGSVAVEALNRGAKICDCLHNTGEGGVSDHHRHGGELIWQIGTGYFGCRNEQGKFDMARFVDVVNGNPIRAIELKLSQGAKPGKGGLLPAAKISTEISQIRGIPLGIDCESPPSHSAFGNVDEMLDFVERLADESGLPIGIKSAVGEGGFWHDLARLIATTNRSVDFITIDGGEGGTGAGPLAFTDHVALPFKVGMSRVFRKFAEHDLQENIVFIGSGRLGLPDTAIVAFALGCDMIHVGREAMMAIGCIQAQRCHTDHCPTGVATQNKWLMRGLHPTRKSHRLANYVIALRKEVLDLCHACGVHHPTLISGDYIEILDGQFGSKKVSDVFQYDPKWTEPSSERRAEIVTLMNAVATPSASYCG